VEFYRSVHFAVDNSQFHKTCCSNEIVNKIGLLSIMFIGLVLLAWHKAECPKSTLFWVFGMKQVICGNCEKLMMHV